MGTWKLDFNMPEHDRRMNKGSVLLFMAGGWALIIISLGIYCWSFWVSLAGVGAFLIMTSTMMWGESLVSEAISRADWRNQR